MSDGRRRAVALLLLIALPWACARSLPPPAPASAPEAAPVPTPPPAEPIPVPVLAPPAPPPAPPTVPLPLTPLRPLAPPRAPALLRVGLGTDLERVTLPCCDAPVYANLAGTVLVVSAPLLVEPLAVVARHGVFRVQVAALKDEGQALALAERLRALTGEGADARFDAASDLYRVRFGRYARRPEAEEAQRRLTALGVDAPWVVSEGAGLGGGGLRVVQGERETRVAGRWLAVEAQGEGGIRVEGRRYRGRILVYLNDRGALNLINELSLEDYLRGVVPREMGPRVYDQVEALKAQAVAARTYTLRNLGEFSEEGYDICATPRCQVYGGMDDEQPLTDEAIAATAGEVLLWNGQPIDALYSSTCGGHTEDVEAIFPLKQAPYLRAVPCLEAGVQSLRGDLEAGEPFPAGLTRRLLPAPGGGERTPAALLGARLEELARLAGLAAPPDRLASLEAREVQRFLASTFDLALDARLLTAQQDLAYLVAQPPPDWRPEELLLAAHLLRLGLLDAARARPLAAAEAEELLLRFALYLGVLVEQRASFLAVGDGALRLRADGEERALPLAGGVATFREQAGRAVAAPLALVAGDRLRLYFQGEGLVAVVQEVHHEGVAFDRTSNYSSWTRFRSDAELRELVRARLPGFELRDFEVLARGRSGRVTRIRLLGADGQTAEVAGLPVRWTLNVPDTLFTVKRLTPKGRAPGWLFTGRGWGHGVGLCQVGAYGMALRGHDYRDILGHYYTGAVLSSLQAAPLAGPSVTK